MTEASSDKATGRGARPKPKMKPGTSVIQPDFVLALPFMCDSTVRLAMALGRYEDAQTLACFPGNRTLMRDTGIRDWRTLKRARGELYALGLRWEPGCGRRPTMYTRANPCPLIAAALASLRHAAEQRREAKRPHGPESGASPAPDTDPGTGAVTEADLVPGTDPGPGTSPEGTPQETPQASPQGAPHELPHEESQPIADPARHAQVFSEILETLKAQQGDDADAHAD